MTIDDTSASIQPIDAASVSFPAATGDADVQAQRERDAAECVPTRADLDSIGTQASSEAPVPKRMSRAKLTVGQQSFLNAWRAQRREHPDVEPTIADLARRMHCSHNTAWTRLSSLVKTGHFVRVRRSDNASQRVYRMSIEAAAVPHLHTLVSLAKDMVRVSPDRVNGEHAEAYATVHARATVVLRDVVAQMSVLRSHARVTQARQMSRGQPPKTQSSRKPDEVAA